MEETRMAIVETLKVTNRVDDKVDRVDATVIRVDDTVVRMDNKVTGLIDGGKNTSLCLLIPEHGG